MAKRNLSDDGDPPYLFKSPSSFEEQVESQRALTKEQRNEAAGLWSPPRDGKVRVADLLMKMQLEARVFSLGTSSPSDSALDIDQERNQGEVRGMVDGLS
ncbi:hypothetical protein LZ554_007681 [Drepanopeziza brunnea f. sp. 'monogermtubi']|nr:hypothetical protein LZ554_007681 [Drepanopeziza brunnea f. sp. 'monogermtubi']